MIDSIVSDPDILGGTPVFKGTRVPVSYLFDYLLEGTNDLQDFVEDYPSVNPQDVKNILINLKDLVSQEKKIELYETLS